MGHGQALVDRQALHLVEDRGVGLVELVGPEDLAGAGDVERRLGGEHGAGLHRGGVGAQHEVGRRARLTAHRGAIDIEGVLHLPRRMIGVEVEGVEVEPLVLELGALGDGPAHGDEKIGDLIDQDVERMPRAGGQTRRGDGDIDGLGGQHAGSASASRTLRRSARALFKRARAAPRSLPAAGLSALSSARYRVRRGPGRRRHR